MEINAVATFEECFRTNTKKTLITTQTGLKLSYGQVWSLATKLVDQWEEYGVKPKESVALMMENDASFLCCFLACAIGGYVACPVTPDLPSNNIKQILNIIKPSIIIKTPVLLPPDVKIRNPKNMSLRIKNDDLYIIIFTSGTTGVAKGICHSFKSVVGSAKSFGNLSEMNETTKLYHILPMTYMAGFLNSFLAPVLSRGEIIVDQAFSPTSGLSFWSKVSTKNINTLIITPTIAASLCRLTRDQKSARNIVKTLKCIQSTAGQLNDTTRSLFLKIFDRPLQDCYGLTELGGPLTTQGPLDARYENCVGRMLPELDCEFKPSTAGNDELWIKSPFLMIGYITEEGVSKPQLKNGYMATGDLGYFQGDKLYITGRSKDMIIRGGVNIAPNMIETHISNVEGVRETAVLGIQDQFWGERIVACILAEEHVDTEVLKKTIRKECEKKLPPNYRPDRITVFEKFPRALNGKVKKHELKKILGQMTDQVLN